MASEAETAWAAGLFEGEGTLAYQAPDPASGRGANVRAELAMTDHEIVRRFHEVVGLGRLEPKKKYADHHADQLHWRLTDREGVMKLLAMFWPWLGSRRRQRGMEILAKQLEEAKRPLRPFIVGVTNATPSGEWDTWVVRPPDIEQLAETLRGIEE